MPKFPKSKKALEIARKAGIFRAHELSKQGIPRVYLRRLEERGFLVREARGLYRVPNAEITENHSLAEAAKRVSHGVVCLLSALRFHGLTTQAPSEVWLAIGWKARAPKRDSQPLRIIRMSGKALTEGVEEHQIEGVGVKIYGPAKTVADCFKYRNKIGLDVALEALRDYRQKYRGGMDELWRHAKICRVERVMRPYLEVLS
ncbi:MAG: type IV toxin-antitoxin system AbiEi family antitoxin domain-containing protein [Deltaproteobacteria bacterium]|nr:type IV toxin-antitoxin system AbiEi family antitoxin domain-containing protein [Deltaproteobacteria bacterium]